MRPKNPTIYPTYTQQIEQLEFGLYRRLNGVSDASARPAVYGNESIFSPLPPAEYFVYVMCM